MKKIRFGTSGWRAIISEDFTFDNVRLVIQAIADYVKGLGRESSSQSRSRLPAANRTKKIVIGYDTRFLSKEFAKEAAEVISANGIRTLLSERDVPTPVIAYHILKKHCDGGINFTASHNPPEYNGIKFSPETGGPAPPCVTKAIEKNIALLKKANRPTGHKAREDLIDIFNPQPAYIKQIERIIDFKAIRKASLSVGVDCLYGTSRGYLDSVLKKHGCRVEVLHDYLNPYFNGKRPSPAQENISELSSLVKKKKFQLGLATDGDGDRFGVIDSDATYITSNQVITLLFYHLLMTREPMGRKVTRTLATTHMIDAIAQRHNIEVVETPVGFKYFVDLLNEGDCVIAGEESGGLSISGHLPEKDGILACLLITEMVAIHRKPIRDILKFLYKRYGSYYSEGIDIALPERKKAKLIARLKAKTFKKFAGLSIIKRDVKDGCKLYLEDGSWVLFRPSGTEPIVRSYFESSSKRILHRLLKEGSKISRF